MGAGLASLALAGGAGVLSTLSPCVLPILPIVLAGAQSRHRFGPLALAVGLAIAFAAMGILVATAGVALGIAPAHFRNLASVVLIALAVVLLSARLQQQLSRFTQGVGDVGNAFARLTPQGGWLGQLMLGLTLGLVWSPCVGPTLGAAIALASQGGSLAKLVLVMLLFAVGASLPLLVLSLMSRQLLHRVKGHLLGAGKLGKQVLGLLLLVLGILALSGLDKRLEAFLVLISPDWLLNLTTSI